MVIYFKKQKRSFDPISLIRKELDTVNNVKIFGLTVSNNLLWNDHINNIVKKTNKRLYFIVLLKCAQVPLKDIIRFYCTCARILYSRVQSRSSQVPKRRSRKGPETSPLNCISRRDIPRKPRDFPINDVTSAKA